MRIQPTIRLFAGAMFATATFAEDNIPASAGGECQWLSISQIYLKLEAAGYGNVEKIERESDSYEVKAADRNGQRVKLFVHPQTGGQANASPQKAEIWFCGPQGLADSLKNGLLGSWRVKYRFHQEAFEML